ncbi:hypothetical protein [Streptomyces anulatus]|uniref:hypothetical protein n=1 Tax=Streptomyces anulatus TaxID=1892 RepID=UPI002E0F4C07|nr:hypothetical protein OG557_01815 [Streptomyces anulatus]
MIPIGVSEQTLSSPGAVGDKRDVRAAAQRIGDTDGAAIGVEQRDLVAVDGCRV